MRINYPYLTDSAFLKLMDTQHVTDQYAKITKLDWNENPIVDIQGVVTGGTINIDGNSSMRRTCNLSVFVNDMTYANVLDVNNLLSINTKIYIEIGIKNNTKFYPEYPIIWYPQGLFVIINPTISRSSSGTNISLQCKDKMCLLNGEVGGIIHSSCQFDQYDTIDENGNWIISRPVIVQIIREAVNHWGGENLDRIIISDLDTRVKQVMRWIGNIPLYFVDAEDGGSRFMTTIASEVEGKQHTIYEYGDDIGFIYTDFTYPGELIIDAGGNVCNVLDKIIGVLGNYEYFYDVYGNFIFQEKKNFLNTTQAKVEINKLNQDDYLLDMTRGKTVYDFNDSNLITSYSNNPQYNLIKNDFIVWGMKENANGNSVPIRYHLAIDRKPKIGNTYRVFNYLDPDDNLIKQKSAVKYSSAAAIMKNQGAAGVFYEDTATGDIYKWEDGMYKILTDEEENKIGFYEITTKDWRTELYLQGTQAEPLGIKSNYYYTELVSEWPKLYDVPKGDFYPEVIKTPSDIDFFLDMIDSGATISKFSISNIGRRTKVIVDDDINCVFAPEIPDFVIIEAGQETTESAVEECIKRNQKYIQVDTSVYKLLATGGILNSAYDMICDLLYQYIRYNNSITIQALPIYYLDANIRIGVRDIESSIFGDYMVSSISIPLGPSGTMSISAAKAIEKK